MISDINLLEHTKQAILALSNPSETNKANEWLTSFERTPESWDVADKLLQQEYGTSFRFFGAKFLYSKTQRQFFQLNEQAVSQLTQNLVQHIIRISQENKIENNVCRYLCLTLATVALQLNQSGIVNQILIWLNPIITSAPAVLLELLMVLPEESHNRQVDVLSTTRDLFIQQLTDSAPDVLSFLSSLWPVVVSNEIKRRILKCAEKWIDMTKLSANVLLSQPIYQYSLESLNHGSTFENAVDVVIAILQRFQYRESNILASVIPIVLQLQPLWHRSVGSLSNVIEDGNDDFLGEDIDELIVCRTICRLYTELAESCMDLFITYEINIGQDAIIHQLLECAKFHQDPDLSRIPLKFFYELSLLISLESGSTAHNTPTSPQKDDISLNDSLVVQNANLFASGMVNIIELNQKYCPVYTQLLDIAITQMMLPDSVLSGLQSTSEEKTDMRVEWRETVLDCLSVLGGFQCLELLCARIGNELTKGENLHNGEDSIQSGMYNNGSNPRGNTKNKIDWSRLEALILGATIIASKIPEDENKYVPELMKFLFKLPTELVRLKVTAIELLGRFSFWLERSHDYLGPILSMLLVDLQTTTTCAPAARAIMNIFRSCRRLPHALPIQELHELILQMRLSGGSLHIEAELFLLEGLSVVISEIEVEENAVAAFKSLLLPIANGLNDALLTHLAQHPEPNPASPIKLSLVLPYVERFTTIFRFFNHTSSISAEIFMSCIPLMKKSLELNASESLCEKICRFYKHAIRCAKRHLLPYITLLTEHLSELYSKIPVAAFLYAASVCVCEFSMRYQQDSFIPLYQMIWKMSGVFFGTFNSLTEFEKKPDVVEEYYFLMAKAIQYCPGPFVESNNESNIVISAGISGLALRHREAQKGILLFFEKFVQLPSCWPESSPLHHASKELIIKFSGPLVGAIFLLLSGQMPAYALDENNGCISDVLWNLNCRFNDVFKTWVAQILPQLPEEAQLIAIKQNLIDSLNGCETQKNLSKVLNRYESACRKAIVPINLPSTE